MREGKGYEEGGEGGSGMEGEKEEGKGEYDSILSSPGRNNFYHYPYFCTKF